MRYMCQKQTNNGKKKHFRSLKKKVYSLECHIVQYVKMSRCEVFSEAPTQYNKTVINNSWVSGGFCSMEANLPHYKIKQMTK